MTFSNSIDTNDKKKKSVKDRPIRAIFSDYDGTLCSSAAARDKSIGQNRMPSQIRQILEQISNYIPLCIISSKDYFFIKETLSFAAVISTLMGLEILKFDVNQQQYHHHHHHDYTNGQSLPPSLYQKLLINENELSVRSLALEAIASDIESDPDFEKISVQRKYTFDIKILVGITVDWGATKN